MDHSKTSSRSSSRSSRSSLEELVRHAYRHCGQILFYISKSTPKQEFNLTYGEVLTYARDACDLFAIRIVAHNFESFGTSELHCLRLHVEIVWDNDTPNSTFHSIRFSWLKDNMPVFCQNEEYELEESPRQGSYLCYTRYLKLSKLHDFPSLPARPQHRMLESIRFHHLLINCSCSWLKSKDLIGNIHHPFPSRAIPIPIPIVIIHFHCMSNS